MPATSLVTRLLATLPEAQPGLFNPWRDPCPGDTALNTRAARLDRLARHLACDPEFLVVGEAAGYQGARRSGIAFTSERLLLEGAIPRIAAPSGRLTERLRPYSEPSATIVWKTLRALGIAERTVLWNALPLHPFRPGAAESNRTPTDAELLLGAPAMRLLVSTFPRARLVAVGRKSELLLQRMGLTPLAQVRHPANGGASAFAAGMAALRGLR